MFSSIMQPGASTPDGWVRAPFKDYCEVKSGGTPSTKEPTFWDGDIPWIGPTDITKNRQVYISEGSKRITKTGLESCNANLVPPGSVILTTRATIADSVIAAVPLATNQSCESLVPNPSKADSQFLHYMIQSNKTRLRRIAHGTTFLGMHPATLADVQFDWPPLEEQRRIAELLSSLDTLADTAASEAEAIEDQVPALLLNFLRDPHASTPSGLKQGIEDAIEFPQGWPTVQLEEISSHITKGSTPTTYGHEWATRDDGIPFFRSECVKPGRFVDQGVAFIPPGAHDEMKRSHVRAGDILVSITGYFGNVCIVPDSYATANINQHIARVRIKSSPEINPRYVYWALRDPRQVRLLQRIQTGQAYPQIGLREVRDITIPLPARNIQDGIVGTLDAMEVRAGSVVAFRNALTTLKTGLLQDLLIGDTKSDTVEVTA